MFQQDFHAYPYQDNSPDDLGKVMYTAAELTTDINPDQRKGKCDTGNNYRGRNPVSYTHLTLPTSDLV